jgi:hypothetical protein
METYSFSHVPSTSVSRTSSVSRPRSKSSSKHKFKKNDKVYIDEVGDAYIKNYDYETNTYTIMDDDNDIEISGIKEDIKNLSTISRPVSSVSRTTPPVSRTTTRLAVSRTAISGKSIGIDPIDKDEISLQDWLSRDNDNIVIIDLNDNLICLKKSYFIQSQVADIYVNCVITNNQLMYQETYNSTEFRNIGYYFGEKYLCEEDNMYLFFNTKSKINIFRLKDREITIDAINKESLLLTNIELFEEHHSNFKFNNIEVYFSELLEKALYNYSYQWDGTINRYLLEGDSTFDSDWFNANYTKFGSTKIEAIENVKSKIKDIDECFMNYAPRNEKDLILYRGMKSEYDIVINETIELLNFTSTSKDKDEAFKFSHSTDDCCLYEFTLEKGIPYIDMISSSYYGATESEILLPRNLLMTYTGIANYKIGGKTVEKMNIRMKYPDQFKIFKDCRSYSIVDIVPYKELKIEKRICEIGYMLDKNNKCTDIKQVSREINDIIDEIQNTKFNFVHIEKICDIVYDSYDIIAKYEKNKNYVTHFFSNIKDYMDKYLKLGWKNYDFHYSRIFENFEMVNIKHFITLAKKITNWPAWLIEPITQEQASELNKCIGGENYFNIDKYGVLKDFINYINFQSSKTLDPIWLYSLKKGTIVDVLDSDNIWKEAIFLEKSGMEYKSKLLYRDKIILSNRTTILKHHSMVIPSWRFFKVNDKVELKYNDEWIIATVKFVNYKEKKMLLVFTYNGDDIERVVKFDDVKIQPIGTHTSFVENDVSSIKLLSQNYTPKLLSKVKRSSPKRSSVKLKRCPKGLVRNKITGICEPKKISTKKRCPNGFKMNKITGICEPK